MKKYTDNDLLYAATARCQKCNSGLAYPLHVDEAFQLRSWVCSAVLKHEGTDDGHDALPFAFYKVREETSINNTGKCTTRPEGTKAMTVGTATCPQCQRTWSSEPYSANGLGHHWFSGPCQCGYAVGSAGTWSTKEGKPIEHRFKDVVIPS